MHHVGGQLDRAREVFERAARHVNDVPHRLVNAAWGID
jgi:hypothetical protein